MIKYIILLLTCFSFSFCTVAQVPVATLPFKVSHNSIILELRLNDSKRVLNMLFDTGADGMAVSKNIADELKLIVNRKQSTSVVGGNMHIDISDGNGVTFSNGFTYNGQSIAIFNTMRGGVDGIIGNTLTKNYVLKVDFDTRVISLFSPDTYTYGGGGTTVKCTIPHGVFIIPGNVEITPEKNYKANFVFDTGAAYSVIFFRPHVRTNKLLVSGFKPEYEGATVSMGISSPTFTGNAKSFYFEKMAPLTNVPVTLMAGNGQNESWSPDVDGSMGMGIISRYNFVLNRSKNEIHFTANRQYNLPMPFTIGGLVLGFNMDRQMEVMATYGLGLNSPATGDAVRSVNGFAADQLLKNVKIIEKIKALPAGTAVKINYGNDSELKEAELIK